MTLKSSPWIDKLESAVSRVLEQIAPDAQSSIEAAGGELDAGSMADTLGDCLPLYLDAQEKIDLELLPFEEQRALVLRVARRYY